MLIGNIFLDCPGCYYLPNWENMHWWGFPFFGLLLIGIFIAIILVVVFLIINSEKSDEKIIMSDAQKILDERYAKGEMTRKEYIQAKDDLTKFKVE